jgi:hypothetical protein
LFTQRSSGLCCTQSGLEVFDGLSQSQDYRVDRLLAASWNTTTTTHACAPVQGGI